MSGGRGGQRARLRRRAGTEARGGVARRDGGARAREAAGTEDGALRRRRRRRARGDGGRTGTQGAEDGRRRARGDGGVGRVAAATAEDSGRRQEATMAVEKFGSLTALCHKWPPVSRSEPRTGEAASFIPPPPLVAGRGSSRDKWWVISCGLIHAPRLKGGGRFQIPRAHHRL